jgi:glycosyltransferase involved in cell wall biosynthesis
MPEATEARASASLRVLYVCYLSLDDPLVHTQVVAYLAGLARLGHTIHLLTFETRPLNRSRRRTLRERLATERITWHGLRYHKRPTLFATAVDVLSGAVCSAWLIRRHALAAFHARSYVPAAMDLMARRLASFHLIFDVRGLMAEEYEDAARWRHGSLPFRLTKGVEKRALSRADAIVVLTKRVREYLFGNMPPENVHVIPCCADLDQIEAARGRRAAVRTRLGVDGRAVLIYVGKLTGWYMEREMVEFFALAREQRPGMHFLIVTHSEPEPIEREFLRLGVDGCSWTILSCEASKVGDYLAAADAGIAFIRPSFSKVSSSPTKVGEYLAAGLPMVCISGIGDVDELLDAYQVGLSLADWSRQELQRGADALFDLIADEGAAGRARSAARERLSLEGIGIPSYDALYRSVSSL